MNSFWGGFEKRAFLGIGVPVASSENKRHHLTIGFPYGVGYDYSLKDEPGWGPTIGVGLTGPRIGLMRKRTGTEDERKNDKKGCPKEERGRA